MSNVPTSNLVSRLREEHVGWNDPKIGDNILYPEYRMLFGEAAHKIERHRMKDDAANSRRAPQS